MAEAIFNNQDLLFCSICLDVLKDPVTIHCGHSYCLGCINNCWDQDDRKGVYSCPQCRQTFTPRPVLNKSTVLAEVVEKLKKTGSQALCYAGPGDVECDFCTVRKLKAVKSCLVCLTSYCVTHLQPHYSLSTLKKHTLVKATQLQEKICSHHERLLEVYCRTDQQCICLLCVMEEHKGHDTVSAEAERNEKQKQFGEKKRKYQKRIQEREKELRELRQAVKTLKHTAGATVDESERIFTELIRSIERRRSEVKEQIRAQEKSAVSRVEGLLQRLEQEVAELKRKDTDLKELSNTEDHIQFLQGFQSLLVSPESYVSPCVTVNPHAPFEAVKKVLSDLRERLETMSKGIAKMSEKIQIDPDPKTKEEFVIYSCQLTMDPNTVFENLRLSEGNRTVTWSKKAQSYPDHPERFTEYDQVLCSEGLSGNCYWEVEWKGARVEIAVSYKGKGLKECGFGYSDQSWCLSCSHSGCTFWYNGIMTKISIPCSSRVGVYLDSRAGTLSFYSISDTMSLLHRMQTAFTQPLYPGFMVGRGESVKIMPPK